MDTRNGNTKQKTVDPNAYYVTIDKNAYAIDRLKFEQYGTLISEMQCAAGLSGSGVDFGVDASVIRSWIRELMPLMEFIDAVIVPFREITEDVTEDEVTLELQKQTATGEIIMEADPWGIVQEDMIKFLCVLDSMKQTWLDLKEKTAKGLTSKNKVQVQYPNGSVTVIDRQTAYQWMLSSIREWHKAVKYILLHTCVTGSRMKSMDFTVFYEELKKVFLLDRFMEPEEEFRIPGSRPSKEVIGDGERVWVTWKRKIRIIKKDDYRVMHDIMEEIGLFRYFLLCVKQPDDEVLRILLESLGTGLENWTEIIHDLYHFGGMSNNEKDRNFREEEGGLFYDVWDCLEEISGLLRSAEQFSSILENSLPPNLWVEDELNAILRVSKVFLNIWENAIQQNAMAMLRRMEDRYQKGKQTKEKKEALEEVQWLIAERVVKDGYRNLMEYAANDYALQLLEQTEMRGW